MVQGGAGTSGSPRWRSGQSGFEFFSKPMEIPDKRSKAERLKHQNRVPAGEHGQAEGLRQLE